MPVVLVPADGEERTWSQRTVVNLARILARGGRPVVKFDFRGQGESSDGSKKPTWTRGARMSAAFSTTPPRRSASRRPSSRCASRQRRSGVLEERPGVRLVAIEPVDDLDAYVSDLLRKNVSSQFVMFKKGGRQPRPASRADRGGIPGELQRVPALSRARRLDRIASTRAGNGGSFRRRASCASSTARGDGRFVPEVPVFWTERADVSFASGTLVRSRGRRARPERPGDRDRPRGPAVSRFHP